MCRHTYTHSHFDSHRDTQVRYPDQTSILHYMRCVADRHGLSDHLRYNSAVKSAVFNDANGTWTMTITRDQLINAETVVWAVGQLHRPSIPSISGARTFEGRAFHSARWDHTADLTGNIAVVGTGSSAAQMVPELARTAASVIVYQHYSMDPAQAR